jgi:hypothetical protein
MAPGPPPYSSTPTAGLPGPLENILALASTVDTLEIIELFAPVARSLEDLIAANPDNPTFRTGTAGGLSGSKNRPKP